MGTLLEETEASEISDEILAVLVEDVCAMLDDVTVGCIVVKLFDIAAVDEIGEKVTGKDDSKEDEDESTRVTDERLDGGRGGKDDAGGTAGATLLPGRLEPGLVLEAALEEGGLSVVAPGSCVVDPELGLTIGEEGL